MNQKTLVMLVLAYLLIKNFGSVNGAANQGPASCDPNSPYDKTLNPCGS